MATNDLHAAGLMYGVMLENFQLVGNSSRKGKVNRAVRAGEIAWAVFSSMVLEIPLGPGGSFPPKA